MEARNFFWSIIIFTNLYTFISCFKNTDNKRSKVQDEIKLFDELLNPKKYDIRIRPAGINGTDGPVIVSVFMFVRSVTKIDDINMDYSVQLTFRQRWIDERLKYNYTIARSPFFSITLTNAKRLWKPDLFFENEKESHFHNLIIPNNYIRISPNGGVTYSVRISLTLSCPMNFKYFPLDQQICTIRMGSYSYTTDDIVFLWQEYEGVVSIKNLNAPKFTLDNFDGEYCETKTITPEYSCLKAIFYFQRNFLNPFMEFYMPCFILVWTSWLTFWIDFKAVTARALLGIVTIFTLSLHISSMYGKIPLTSYIKIIDIWFGVCFLFILAALIEFLYVYNISQKVANDEKHEIENQYEKDMKITEHYSNNCYDELLISDKTKCLRTRYTEFSKRTNKIDLISRIAFPVSFLFFNVIYWSINLNNRKY